MTELRVALLASCTIEVLQKPLAAELEKRGIQAEFWVGGFGQYRQDILNAASGLYGFGPAVVVLYLDGEDVFKELIENPLEADAGARRELALRRAGEVRALVETMAERLPQATVMLNTAVVRPLNALTGLEYNSGYGIEDAVSAYNEELGRLARSGHSAVVVDAAALAAWIGYARWQDTRMWCLARSRWSRAALQALAERYTAAICGRLGRIRKCIALDLDNTLWGGIIGEDGMEGIRLGEDGTGRAFVEFQSELLNLYRKGILLAVCSKNNPEDALQAIRRHPAMRLREEHFAALRINWEDKASNLRAMAEQLNIGLDSMVFLDDNPAERTWVRQAAPEVLVPEWPADPGEYKGALLELAAAHFHKLGITAEDRKRGEIYQAQAERWKLEAAAGPIEDFYRGLEMRVKIGRAESFTIPRIAQLTQKTNQFNVTTRRYTEADIRAMSQDPECAIFWLDLTDRFGPSGVVGVLILKREAGDVWLIDTFLLSCRVMGRTVESAFLAVVVREPGAARLIGEYRPTAKNAPVKDLYPKLGFEFTRQAGESRFWELDLRRKELRVPEWFEVEMVRGSVA